MSTHFTTRQLPCQNTEAGPAVPIRSQSLPVNGSGLPAWSGAAAMPESTSARHPERVQATAVLDRLTALSSVSEAERNQRDTVPLPGTVRPSDVMRAPLDARIRAMPAPLRPQPVSQACTPPTHVHFAGAAHRPSPPSSTSPSGTLSPPCSPSLDTHDDALEWELRRLEYERAARSDGRWA